MKVKRNKSVLQQRKKRQINRAGDSKKQLVPRFSFLTFLYRRPKSFALLLEQDAKAQAERLASMKAVIESQFSQPQLVPETVEETNESAPESNTLVDGRTNYQYSTPNKRVRRRIML